MHPILMAEVARLRSEEIVARAERRRLARCARLEVCSIEPVRADKTVAPRRWSAATIPLSMRR